MKSTYHLKKDEIYKLDELGIFSKRYPHISDIGLIMLARKSKPLTSLYSNYHVFI